VTGLYWYEMNPFLFFILLAPATLAFAAGPGVAESFYSKSDFALTADPNARPWKNVPGVIAANGPLGDPTPGHRTEIRSRWTDHNLYFLFICPYEQLNLKPNPSTDTETNKLWTWDVAEAFIGTDFDHIRQYKEFQVSPQSEWVDLDIDRDNPKPEGGWLWNSGFTVKGRIDRAKKVWYGEMKIPIDKIDTRKPKDGLEMRINFYRLQGPGPDRKGIAWQPTHQKNYHVPEAFGRLVLRKAEK
jgi:hypothetical protein